MYIDTREIIATAKSIFPRRYIYIYILPRGFEGSRARNDDKRRRRRQQHPRAIRRHARFFFTARYLERLQKYFIFIFIFFFFSTLVHREREGRGWIAGAKITIPTCVYTRGEYYKSATVWWRRKGTSYYGLSTLFRKSILPLPLDIPWRVPTQCHPILPPLADSLLRTKPLQDKSTYL